MKVRNLQLITSLSLGTLWLVACASPPKATLAPDADPQAQLEEVKGQIQSGYAVQADVLAPTEFRNARMAFEEAEEDFKDSEDREDILENIAVSKGYLGQVDSKVNERKAHFSSILEARQKALTAGANNYIVHREQLNELDEELRDFVGDPGDLTLEDRDRLQEAYLALEIKVTKTNEIGQTRAQFDAAKRQGAEELTPKTFADARQKIMNADNLISSHFRDPEGYQVSVTEAKEATLFLTEVLQQAKRSDNPIPEAVAVDLVNKARAVSSLNSELSDKESALQQKDSNLESWREYASEQRQQLANQAEKINLEEALKNAEAKFDDQEAEVYQQGDKLLIRLKALNFKSGKAEIPEASQSLLDKVSEVAQELNAVGMTVEGHTDTTGSKTINMSLSQKRAANVARYFNTNGMKDLEIETVGYGYKRPITTNDTAEGRAINRRVDVIISPSGPERAPSETSEM